MDTLVDSAGEIMWEEETHWGERYISDHCARTPECCVQIDEDLDDEDLWDGGDDNEEFCRFCPGAACQCFQDEEGRWWINYTVAGTDDDPLNPLVPVN